MKNNKILMSLVLASISAMGAAPFVIQEKKNDKNDKNDGLVANNDTTVIEGKKVINLFDANKTPSLDASIKDDFTKQMDAMLMKKSSIQHLSDNVSILVDSYGKEDKSLKEEIYKELNLAQSNRDSSVTPPGNPFSTPGGTTNVPTPLTYCHSACHGACHSACHGARGWR